MKNVTEPYLPCRFKTDRSVHRIRLRWFQKIFFNKDKSISILKIKIQIDPTLPWNLFLNQEKWKQFLEVESNPTGSVGIIGRLKKILSDELAES